MKRTLPFIFGVFTSLFCYSQTQLVKDINTGLSQMRDANDYSPLFIQSGNLVYFPVNDSFGNELWKTDGTSQGTQRVIDLNPGSGDGYWGSSISFQNKLFFNGSNGSLGTELWATDGTASGTVLIKDVVPGSDSSYPSGFFEFGGKLYFLAITTSSLQLWRTDGTSAGTELFFDYGSSSALDQVAGTSLFYFFTSTYDNNDNSTIYHLWKSDGTAAANVMDFPYTSGSIIPSYLNTMGDVAYFSADDGTGPKIWRSDGTASGTYPIENYYGSSFMHYNGKLLYSANGSWYVTDGSVGGSIVLSYHNVYTGCAANGKFYGLSNNSIIETDGTYAGTTEVASLGTVFMFHQPPVVANKIITAYNPGSTDYTTQEIGVFDLDTKSITLLKDIKPGAPGSNPRAWSIVNGKAIFLADDGIHGIKIWETDGTTSGTQFLSDPTPETGDSYPNHLTTIGGKVLFTATPAGADYPGLWETDGEGASTVLLDTALMGGYLGTMANEAYYVDNLVFYKTNGLPGGKQTLMDLSAQSNSWGFQYRTAVAGGRLYFSFGSYGGSLITGKELWVTDGTTNGSHIVKDIIPGVGSGILNFSGADLNSKLVFPATDGTNGTELWMTDGSDPGTSMIKDINPGAANSSPSGFASLGSYVFFSATDDSHGTELWKTDGTATGTTLVKDINTGSSSAAPTQLVAFNNLLYFIVNGDNLAKSLWKSDGTEAGTTMVMTFNSGITSLVKSVDKLFLNADDGIHGQELWVSDGTAAGTVLIDIDSGGGSSSPTNFFTADSICYFNANGGIWKSRGTNETTILVSGATATSNFAVLNTWLYFGANSPDYGKELFKAKIKAYQTISFPDVPTKTAIDSDFPIGAKPNSGLPVTLTLSNSNVVQLVNGVAHIVGTGTVTVTASQDGNDDFESAQPVSKTLTVVKAPQQISFADVPIKTFTDSDFIITATSNSGLPVTLQIPNSNVIQLENGVARIIGVGTVTITAIQDGNSKFESAQPVSRTFTVVKASQQISFADPPTKTFGDSDFVISAASSSGLPVTLQISNSNVIQLVNGVAHIVGAGTVTITAGQDGNDNFGIAQPVSKTLTVAKASQKISFADLPTKTFGDSDFAVPATVNSDLPVSLQISNSNVVQMANGIAHIVGAGIVTITASQNGNNNFESAQPVFKTLTVNKASQTLTFPVIAAKSVDDLSFTLTANASSGLSVTFSTSSTNVQLASNSVTLLRPGKVRIKAAQSGDSNYDSVASVTQEFCVNPTKPSITMLLASSIEDALMSSSKFGNVWYHDSAVIPDTTKVLKPTASGSYQVQVVIDGCQSPMSDPVAFVVTGLEQERQISAHPNPTSQTITIDLPIALEPTDVSIINISGIQVARINSTASSVTVDMSTLPSGLYFAKVEYAGKPVMIKIVKI